MEQITKADEPFSFSNESFFRFTLPQQRGRYGSQLSSTVMLAQCRPLLIMIHISTDHGYGFTPNSVAGKQRVYQSTDFMASVLGVVPFKSVW